MQLFLETFSLKRDNEWEVLLPKEPDEVEFLDEDNCIEIPEDATEWSVKLTNFSLSSYVEVEVKVEEEVDDDIMSIPLMLNVGEHQRCDRVSVKSVPRYAYSGNLGVIRSYITKNMNVTQSKAYFVYLVGFLCNPVSNGYRYNRQIPSYFTSTFAVNLNNSNVVTAFCDMKILHPEPFKCGRAQIPLNGKSEVHSLEANIPEKYGDFSSTLQAKVTHTCNEFFQLDHADDQYQKNDGLLCGPDGRWIGQPPTCRPTISCPMIKITSTDRITLDYEDYTYWNGSETAYKNTKATYSCKNSINVTNELKLTLSGNQIVTCQTNGSWSHTEPQCLYPHELLSEETGIMNLPFFLVIVTLLAAFLLLSLIAGIASYIYVRKVRARKRKERNRKRNTMPGVNMLCDKKREEDNYYTISYGDLRKSQIDNYIIPADDMDGYAAYNDQRVAMYAEMSDTKSNSDYDDIFSMEEHNYISVIENYANEMVRKDERLPSRKTRRRPPLPVPIATDDLYSQIQTTEEYTCP